MSDLELEPNCVERIERYELDRDKIEELVETGFKEYVFLGGKPGSAQTVKFSFDWDHNPRVMVELTTLEKAWED
jgi:hypothetical protein